MAEMTERNAVPPQKRIQAQANPVPAPEPPTAAAVRTADAAAPETQPVPIPGGADTATTVEQIQVRRRQPVLTAVRYDGSNAVQVGAWLLSQGQASCRVDFLPNKLPILLRRDDTPVGRGWVLPNLEVVSEQDLTTIYEKVPTA